MDDAKIDDDAAGKLILFTGLEADVAILAG